MLVANKKATHSESVFFPMALFGQEIWMESLPIKDEDVPYFLPGSGDDWTKAPGHFKS